MCKFVNVLCEFQSKRARCASAGSLRSLWVRSMSLAQIIINASCAKHYYSHAGVNQSLTTTNQSLIYNKIVNDKRRQGGVLLMCNFVGIVILEAMLEAAAFEMCWVWMLTEGRSCFIEPSIYIATIANACCRAFTTNVIFWRPSHI